MRERRQFGDGFGLLERQIVDLCFYIGEPCDDLAGRGELDQARFLDPRAFDVAIERRRLTEQPGAVAVAARQFARQHSLRIGDAGTNLELAGDEEIGDGGGIGRRACRKQAVIGRHDIRHAGRRPLRVGERLYHRVIEGERLVVAALAGQEGGVARAGRSERIGFGIFDRERIDRFAEARIRRAHVAQCLFGQCKLAEHLRTQPDDRSDTPLPHGQRVSQTLELELLGGLRIAAEAIDGAEQMRRLCVDDLRALERAQTLAVRCLADGAGVAAAVDPRGDRRGQRDAAVGGFDRCGGRRHRTLQDFGGARIVALVERIDRLKIAPQPQLHRVARRDRIDFGEQARGFSKFAEVRFLERAVEREFARIDVAGRRIVRGAARQRFEKFGRFGIVAAVVAAIAFGERPVEVDRPGERARKAFVAAADRRGRDLDDARCDLVLADRLERERQRVAISGKAFGGVGGRAVHFDAACPFDAAAPDRAATIGAADDVGIARRRQPLRRVGFAGTQRADITDGLARIAADDHPGAVEHALDDGVADRRLHLAQRATLAADRKAVAERRIFALRPDRDRCRCGEQRQQGQAKRRSYGHHDIPPGSRHRAPGHMVGGKAQSVAAVRPIPVAADPKPLVAKREVICRTGGLRAGARPPICHPDRVNFQKRVK